jgi:hypothetical protein
MHEDVIGKALAAAIGVDRVIAKPDGMTKPLECMRNVLELGTRQSPTVGPFGAPVDPTPGVNQPVRATLPEEKATPVAVARLV